LPQSHSAANVCCCRACLRSLIAGTGWDLKSCIAAFAAWRASREVLNVGISQEQPCYRARCEVEISGSGTMSSLKRLSYGGRDDDEAADRPSPAKLSRLAPE
jgi:hypothetical protein